MMLINHNLSTSICEMYLNDLNYKDSILPKCWLKIKTHFLLHNILTCGSNVLTAPEGSRLVQVQRSSVCTCDKLSLLYGHKYVDTPVILAVSWFECGSSVTSVSQRALNSMATCWEMSVLLRHLTTTLHTEPGPWTNDHLSVRPQQQVCGWMRENPWSQVSKSCGQQHVKAALCNFVFSH